MTAFKFKKTQKHKHNPNSHVKPLLPEQLERMLHGKVLKNPPLPKIEEAHSKGTTMPDLTTALKTALENSKREALNKTLNAWEQDEKETQLEKPVATGKQNIFETTNNVTRATFEYVRDNPRCTREQVFAGLKQYNETSVGSLLSQFVLQERIHRNEKGEYTALSSEYKPLVTRARWYKMKGIEPAKKKNREKGKKIIIVKRRTVEDVEAARAASGIETLAVAEAKKYGSFKQHKAWSPEEVIDTLNVIQARQLYDYLKKVFGG